MLDRPSGLLPHELTAALRTVADKLCAFEGLILAVSGGPDSLAMLHGVAQLKAAGSLFPDVLVVTVDHGLRVESASEADFVVGICNTLGIAHKSVRLAEKPDGANVQAWARYERYRVFAEAAQAWKSQAKAAVVTAHTADDQAETVLMRAARGAGSEALAAIRPDTVIADVQVLRPFLSWTRAQLHTLLPSHIDPVLDPSNTEERFTRVRYRRWLAEAPTPDSARPVSQGLAETARIARLESDALDHEAAKLFGAVDGAQLGYISGSIVPDDVPLAIAARFVRHVMLAVARAPDAAQRLDMARMVEVAERILSDAKGKSVLAGCVLEWSHSKSGADLLAYAEAGRTGFPEIDVEAGCSALWDGRFDVKNDSQRACTLRAWQSGDLLSAAPVVPRRVLASLPVAVRGETVLAGPGTAKGEVSLHVRG